MKKYKESRHYKDTYSVLCTILIKIYMIYYLLFSVFVLESLFILNDNHEITQLFNECKYSEIYKYNKYMIGGCYIIIMMLVFFCYTNTVIKGDMDHILRKIIA